jgi:tRNA pseudouridine38-40 synthase
MIRLSFLGTKYHGWQIQPNLPTVQGEIKKALEKILGIEVQLIGCCRTDAGVHAKDYVANFITPKEMDPTKLVKALNSLLPEDIGIKEVRIVPETFNSRYSVKGKVYLYRIFNKEYRDPFEFPFSWHVPKKLNEFEMRKAVIELSGCHDFKGFAKVEGEKRTQIPLTIELTKKGDLYFLRFSAPFFLRYLVRRLTAYIVLKGLGKKNLLPLKRYLLGQKFPYTAPGKGLFLEEVKL